MSAKLFSHMFGNIALAKFVGGESPALNSGLVHAGLTLDGVFYKGTGATVRAALNDLAVNVDNWNPALKPGQVMSKLTKKTPSYMNMWQHMANNGETFLDRSTGRMDKIVTVLPNGYIVMENTYGVDPKPRPIARPVEPITDPVCHVCGGNANECYPTQVAADSWECRNSRRGRV